MTTLPDNKRKDIQVLLRDEGGATLTLTEQLAFSSDHPEIVSVEASPTQFGLATISPHGIIGSARISYHYGPTNMDGAEDVTVEYSQPAMLVATWSDPY